MRLISLSFRDPKNSLQDYEFEFDNHRSNSDALEPICLVGLNGSGKSKLLEILAKIFFEMDSLWRNKAKSKPKLDVNFRLEYHLLPQKEYTKIIVDGRSGQSLMISADGKEIQQSEIPDVMPTNIVGYSSGHNETIGELFLKLREHEFRETRVLVDAGKQGNLELSRTLFLDRHTSQLLLITAFIFSEQEGRDGFPSKEASSLLLSKFSEFIHLKQLLSFQLIFDLDGGRIILSQRMEETLQKLKRCALMSQIKESEKERSYTLDFFLCEISKFAFIHEFETAQDFFERLYELMSLNLISNTKSKQHTVFSIPESELKVLISNPLAETHYFNLSDGEHQFIQIFTALVLFSRQNSIFLLDEPESHFNPAWRAKFVLLIDELLSNKQKGSEFLISTHSPYLVSACKKRNVFKFSRNAEGNGVDYEPLIDETYGASFEVLLRALFDMKGLVAEIARTSLQEVIESQETKETKLLKLKNEFGDSFEKRLLINMLEKGLFDAVQN